MPDTPDTAPELAEQEWLRRAQAGDENAFGDLVRAHYEPVFRRICAILRNEHDAQDVTQEVWVAVWHRLKDYRGDARFSTWLFAIATRRAIDHLRKRRRWFDRFLPFLGGGESEKPLHEPASPAPTPHEHLETGERHRRFETAIASLPPKHQAVLAMREIEGLSYDEIAQTLHCKTGTVMSRLFHARRLLAQKLGDLPCE